MKTVNLQRTVTAIPDLRKKRILQQESILIKRLRAVTAIGVHPVSYTHLDVYKRQEESCPGRHRPCPMNWRERRAVITVRTGISAALMCALRDVNIGKWKSWTGKKR